MTAISKAQSIKAQLEAKIAEGLLQRSELYSKHRWDWVLDNLICRFRSAKYFEIVECIETGEVSIDGKFKEVVVAMVPKKKGDYQLRSQTAVIYNDSSDFVLVLDKKTDFVKFCEIIDGHVEKIEKEIAYWIQDPVEAWHRRGEILAKRDERRDQKAQENNDASEQDLPQQEVQNEKPRKSKAKVA